jgi:hypothetical protein
MTINSPNALIVDYTFKIRTTARGYEEGTTPTLSSTYTLKVECGSASVWEHNNQIIKYISNTKDVGGTSATDYFETSVWNINFDYCKNCRILSEYLTSVKGTYSDPTTRLHTYI